IPLARHVNRILNLLTEEVIRDEPAIPSASSRCVSTAESGRQEQPTRAAPAAPSIDQAHYGECVLSKSAVSPDTFGCLAVARSNENMTRLFASVRGSLDAAQTAVLEELSNAGRAPAFSH